MNEQTPDMDKMMLSAFSSKRPDAVMMGFLLTRALMSCMKHYTENSVDAWMRSVEALSDMLNHKKAPDYWQKYLRAKIASIKRKGVLLGVPIVEITVHSLAVHKTMDEIKHEEAKIIRAASTSQQGIQRYLDEEDIQFKRDELRLLLMVMKDTGFLGSEISPAFET
jgi:hypothetical protein